MPSVADEEQSLASVNDAIESLEKASKIPAKLRGPVKVSSVVDVVCSYAFENGLEADNLRAVIRIVSKKTELDQSSVTSLIKNLYPSQRVPSDVTVIVVGALGQGKGKPSAGTQNSLVKWLTLVHGIIDDPKALSRLYGVLFGLLDMISIRTPLCHLLSLITRRVHVKPFRIQQILELSRGLGNEPALQGLLRIYKDYYPDIILSSTVATRNSFRPPPDEEWQKRLSAIQHGNNFTDYTAFDRQNGFRVFRNETKRIKDTIVPELRTLYASETTVTLEEIDNVQDFVQKLDRIEPPGQMISFLADPLLQKYVELRPSAIVSRRIELWLSSCLEEEYNVTASGRQVSPYLGEILEGLYMHTQYTKKLSPLVSKFLEAYLPIWDGSTAVDAVLGLLSYIPVQPFKDVYATYLGPLEQAIARRGAQSYEKLLRFYADLLQHWALQNHRLRSSPSHLRPDFTNRKHLEELGTHVCNVCLSLSLSLPSNTGSPLLSSILSFYEAASAITRPGILPIILPPPHLSCLLTQSASTTTLSRICGIYASFKTAFDKHPPPLSEYYPQSTITAFNGCVRDMYNLLWGSKALQSTERSAGLYCDPQLREALGSYLIYTEHEYAIGQALDFSHNAMLASLSAAAWWSLEEAEIDKQGYERSSVNYHKGPVTQQSLEALDKNRGVIVSLLDYKKHVLQWMADRGISGMRDLMFVTHSKLRN